MIINGFGGAQGPLTDDNTWVTLASLTFSNQACTSSASVWQYDTNNSNGYDLRPYKYIRVKVNNYSFTGTHRSSSSSKSYACYIAAGISGMSNWSGMSNYMFYDRYFTGYGATAGSFTTNNYSVWEYLHIAHCQKSYLSNYGGYYYIFYCPPVSTATGASAGIIYYYPNNTSTSTLAYFQAGYKYSDSDGAYVSDTAYLNGTFTLQAHA